MPLRAIIFDFDGLILDTETPEVRAWQSVFRSRGAEYPDAAWMNAIGRGADQIQEKPLQLLERLLGYPCDQIEVETEFERLWFGSIEVAEALAGVRELIQEAKENSLGLGLASSSKHAWVDTHLARLGLFDQFDAILCADDVTAAKPFPDLYLAACSRLGVHPSEGVALEDSPNGIKAAKAAGLFCIAIPNPCTICLNLKEADHQVASMAELNVAHLQELLERSN